MKKINWNAVIITFTFISLVVAAIAISIIIAFTPSQKLMSDPNR